MRRWLLVLGVMALGFSAACGNLAGDPVIIGTVPAQVFAPQNTPAPLVPPAAAPDLALGAQVYAENCVRCHGEFGAGDGEFVRSGQITEIPNFTELEATEGNTPAEYYQIVTLGLLDAGKLMPGFDSLNDSERWAVANYVFTLAGREIVAAAPLATEEAAAPESTQSAAAPEGTQEAAPATTGVIRGGVIHGTSGSTVPADLLITLHIVDSSFNEVTSEMLLNADGTFLFTDVPIDPHSGYFVSADYGETFFTSSFLNFDGSQTALDAQIVLYDTTSDPAVIQVNSIITQFDLNGDRLQMLQLITVTNTSDRLFITENASGEAVSLRLPAPVGARPTADNDSRRLKWVGAESAFYDTRPVVPGGEHTLHVIYDLPFERSLDITQTFDYVFAGPFEAYADTSRLRIDGDGWVDLGVQTMGSVSYGGQGRMPSGENAGTFRFSVISTAPLIELNQETISRILLIGGVSLIVLAGVLYFLGRRSSAATPVTEPAVNQSSKVQIDAIMRQITELDDQFQQKKISEAKYRKQRDSLKAQLAALMKSVK